MFFTKNLDPDHFCPFLGSPTKGGSGYVQGVSKIGLQKSKITILTWKSMSDPPNILYNCSKPPRDLPRTCSIELWRFVGSKIGFSHILPSKWSKMTDFEHFWPFLSILKAFRGRIWRVPSSIFTKFRSGDWKKIVTEPQTYLKPLRG